MSFCVAPLSGYNATAAKVDVGVILSLDQTVGKISKTCISMAIEDFYSNRDYSTMIVPHFRNSSSDVVAAASAAVDLLKNTQVMAILGPQKSIQADFVIQIGNKVKVPIISPATSPALSPKESEYFIRSSWSASSQVKAIAAIVKKFGWREVVFVHEDTNYGSALVPFWTEDLRESKISYQSVISPTASKDQILLELIKLKEIQTRVYIVHMLPDLASNFFLLVKEAGMMEKGYVWIIADVHSSLLDSMEPNTVEAMQGVIGVKAYIPMSKELDKFTRRWRKRFDKENPGMDRTKLDVLGLWAYDSITVLAEAIERVGLTSPEFNGLVDGENLTDLEAIGTSKAGDLLLPSIRNHVFKGLSGIFNISDGELQTSAFEIVNVNRGRENTVGFWSEQCGFSSVNPYDCSSEEEDLDPIIWPGKPKEVPKGWEIPRSGKKLRVGLPLKGGFNEFIQVTVNDNDNTVVKATGFCIDIFEYVMELMPVPIQYQYVAFKIGNADYGALVEGIYKKFDVVVADLTVTSRRSEYVDFTFPYTESGVAIVVPISHNKRKNAWIFMKPLTTSLWLTIGAFFVFTGFVVWVLEHRVNKEFRGPPRQQVGMMFWFSFSTLVFAHREKVQSNLTRFVLIVWVFVVLVLQSSYTANLTSMLTVDQLQPKITDISDIIKNKEYVGIQTGSFVEGFLKNMSFGSLGRFNTSLLRNYSTVEEFDEAITKGSKNGGVGAIIDELPYMRLLLNKYCHKYTMIGPIYPTSGLGFAFPKGSPLVAEVSRAIVKLKEQEKMMEISARWLEGKISCSNTSDGTLSTSQSLNLDSFKGLFVIAGVSSSLALAVFLSDFLYENRSILASTASKKQKLYELAGVFSRGKDVASSDNGGVHAANPSTSIPCDEGEMFSQDEGFSVVETTPSSNDV